MAYSRNDEWNSTTEIYSPSEVEAVLKSLGVEVLEETENDFVSLCPYHGNTDSPAFSTSKRYGYSICFNPSCAKGSEFRLTLDRLVKDLKGLDQDAAKHYVLTQKGNAGLSFEDKFDSLVEEQELEFPQAAIDKMHERFTQTRAAQDYMAGRGFTMDTMEYFKVGFTPASSGPIYRPFDMVVVPAYDHKSHPMGIVGRSIEGKEFKNYGPGPKGTGFHKSKIVWNLQHARRYETIILTEATFDAMRVHQAGYPNVGALLGGSLSEVQKQLLNRHFRHVVIFTDDENKHNGGINYPRNCTKCLKLGYNMCQGHRPGRDLGMKIAESLPHMEISWATYNDKYVYADHAKDAASMTDEQIRQCLRNAISHYEYLDWNP